MKSGAITSKNTWKIFKNRTPFVGDFSTFVRGSACDKILLLLAVCISAFGLVMVYSSSYILSQEKYGSGLVYFNKHLVLLGIGYTLMMIMRYIDLRFWEKLALPFYILCMVCMVMALIPGLQHRAGGAARWVKLGSLTFQPIEFARISIVLMMARSLSRTDLNYGNWKEGFLVHLWPGLLLIGVCMLQPDFGSSALVVAIMGVMLFLGGVRTRYLFSVAAVALPFAAAAMILAPYRRARVLSFLNPWADPQGAGFQVIQSFIAFFRGGLFGVGLGNSKAKIFYLPEAHNDFILSIVGEELGFIGIFLLMVGFFTLFVRGYRVAAKSNHRFSALFSAGAITLIGLSTLWNASVVLGLFPNKGMNMPLVSSGGTSLLSALALIGMLLAASSQTNVIRDRIKR